MSSLGIYGIPSLVVMDSGGKIITTSGRGAVEANPDGCIREWSQGKSGATWTSGINWTTIVLYGGLFLGWWWYSHTKKTSEE